MKDYLGWFAPLGAAMALIVSASIVEGVWTDRWGKSTSEDLQRFVAALDMVPMKIGDPATGVSWQGEASKEPRDAKIDEVAGAVGQISRTYSSERDPAGTVVAFMICGPSRNVAIHTPDACYPGAGFTMEGKPTTFRLPYPVRGEESARKSSPMATATFTTAVFTKNDARGQQRVRVFWAWNADGTWESPEFPRARYGGRRALNKVYLVGAAPPDQPIEENAAVEFARYFLPAADRAIFPSKADPAS